MIGSTSTTTTTTTIPTTNTRGPPAMATKKGKRQRTGPARDPLQMQVSARIARTGKKIGGNLIREAIQYRLDHGEDPPGIELKIVQWRNPGRKSAALRAWRTGSQDAAWSTLGNALRGWLAQSNDATVAFRQVRKSRDRRAR